jgi:DNA-binding NarL/FixJ family response regulator
VVALVRRKVPPVSVVVLSDDEVEADIRAANAGQPAIWVQEQVDEALKARAARAAALQDDYDRRPPARPYKTED